MKIVVAHRKNAICRRHIFQPWKAVIMQPTSTARRSHNQLAVDKISASRQDSNGISLKSLKIPENATRIHSCGRLRLSGESDILYYQPARFLTHPQPEGCEQGLSYSLRIIWLKAEKTQKARSRNSHCIVREVSLHQVSLETWMTELN